MIYTFTILILGIYMGQEYHRLPSVKMLYDGAMSYIFEDDEQHEEHENIYNLLKNLFRVR